MVVNIILVVLGWVCVLLGVVGAFLPLLPTTPFLILAAFFFSKGSPRLHQWLLTHPQFGSLIMEWERYGVIRPRAKRVATIAIVITFANTLIFVRVGVWVKLVIAAVGLLLLGFIWTRPSDPGVSKPTGLQ